MTQDRSTPSVPRYMRCEPSEHKHVFSGTDRKCDCGKRHWPPDQSTFVIPNGEIWAVIPDYPDARDKAKSPFFSADDFHEDYRYS